MNLVDRFSTHVHEVLGRAIKTATEQKHRQVEPVHLLSALASQTGSMASQILKENKVTARAVEEELGLLPQENPPAAVRQPAEPAGATAQIILAPLSDNTKLVVEKAMMLAYEFEHSFVGTEHLLAAIIEVEDQKINGVLKFCKVDKKNLLKQLDGALENAGHLSQMSDASELAGQISDSLFDLGAPGMSPLIPPALKPNKNSVKKARKNSALNFFATELTAPEAQTNIDPLIGRSAEVERLEQILYRRTKNNPVLLGDPGVGKTAIVEGLAKKIFEGQVPAALKNKKIYALDMGLLIAGTMYRGDFEARLKQVVEEVSGDPNTILFIDEIHNVAGAGSNNGTMDAGNILKPALARGLIHCIGATTPSEFKKHIESDPALERRFQPIMVREPSPEDTVKILKGVKKNYEKYHHVKIDDNTVEMIVELSNKFIHNQFFPDKAIDLLDETAAAKRLEVGLNETEQKFWEVKKKLADTVAKKEEAALADRFEEAVKLKDEEKQLDKKLKELQAKMEKSKDIIITKVGPTDVIKQVAKITGLQIDDIDARPGQGDAKLVKQLKSQIIGQDAVIERVAETIVRAKLGLQKEDRPLASLLFVGESDTGKTELGKLLAKALYPNQDALIKLNMSEYSEGFSVSKLLGSPAGYVGYREANQFTDKVKLNPYCVVLFDEIDKAHKDVVRLLLQILDNGEITDATGKKISFKHAIIVLTTNIGADEIKKGDFGFGGQDGGQAEPGLRKRVVEKLKNHFSPEIINRLDEICLFESLKKEDLTKIAALEVSELNKVLKKYQTEIALSETALNWMVPKENWNARELRRKVRKELEGVAAEMILKKQLKARYQIRLAENRLRAV